MNARAHDVHTSAHQATSAPEADLFPAEAAEAARAQTDHHATAPAMVCTGVLAHAPELRSRVLPTGQAVPVLCFDLQGVGPGLHQVHAEQVFTDATRSAAEALAKRFKAGQRVTLAAAALDMRLVLPHVQHIEAAN